MKHLSSVKGKQACKKIEIQRFPDKTGKTTAISLRFNKKVTENGYSFMRTSDATFLVRTG